MKAININWVPSTEYQDRTKVLKYITKNAIVNAVKDAQAALSIYDSARPDGSPDMMAKAQLFDEYQRLVALYNEVMAGNVKPVEEAAQEVEAPKEVKPIYEKTLRAIVIGLKNFADGRGVNFMFETAEVLKDHTKDQLISEITPYINEEFGKSAGEILQLFDTAIGEDNGKSFIKTYEEGVQASKKSHKAQAKKTEVEAEPKAEKAHTHRADAQERLDKYSKELLEKEALLKADNFASKDGKKACIKRIASLNRKIARAKNSLGNNSEK